MVARSVSSSVAAHTTRKTTTLKGRGRVTTATTAKAAKSAKAIKSVQAKPKPNIKLTKRVFLIRHLIHKRGYSTRFAALHNKVTWPTASRWADLKPFQANATHKPVLAAADEMERTLPKLTEAQERWIDEAVTEKGMWTGKELQEAFQAKYGKEYNIDVLRAIIAHIKQTPRRWYMGSERQ